MRGRPISSTHNPYEMDESACTENAPETGRRQLEQRMA